MGRISNQTLTLVIQLPFGKAGLFVSLYIFSIVFVGGDPPNDSLSQQDQKRIEQHQRYTQYFGLTDPLMELQYNGSFYCGDKCFGISCMNLSPAELRLRQHKFKPGEDWIGSSKI